jgi:hypothetical protein
LKKFDGVKSKKKKNAPCPPPSHDLMRPLLWSSLIPPSRLHMELLGLRTIFAEGPPQPLILPLMLTLPPSSRVILRAPGQEYPLLTLLGPLGPERGGGTSVNKTANQVEQGEEGF